MQIVINGALPEPAIARELIKHLAQTAPNLIHLLAQGKGALSVRDPAVDLCTPAQSWLLHAHGFTAHQAQHLSAGLAPLRLRQLKQIQSLAADEPVWLAELVHIAPSREGAMLLPSEQLALSESYSRSLLDAIRPYLDGTGFQFEYLSPELWRITPPADFTVQAASTELVSQSNLNNWWTQDVQTRPWRRLINEFQMLSFALPDKQERQQAGLPNVNSLWLFGGATCNQLGPEPAQLRVIDDLQDSLIRQDWGLWLQQLAELDRTVLAPLAAGPVPELVLTGLDRYAQVGPFPRRIWPLSLLKQTSNWSQWWSPLS
ncbi:hypothetical protein GCM10010096_27220 [Alcaligenes pakistanensis]|uniref:Phosphoglycerate mutase n=1 Tax=Alcaligenes pakistanensis TaxID=1482717 RepID=A0A8H9IJJ1_9BURK|nr:hypothetical protein [Alcaligenes pakistanensis]GHC53454.1 hypothetical protein GCM10010096_27220 [Alcaligenes pakistanensis]HCA17087.1 hypothetical protein [Alcaligenes faecalis]